MKLGILEDLNEWETVMSEAFSSLSGRRARSLFATMLVFCDIPNPIDLFDKFFDVFVEDFRYCNPDCSSRLLRACGLHNIEQELITYGRCLLDYNLPQVDHSDLLDLQMFLCRVAWVRRLIFRLKILPLMFKCIKELQLAASIILNERFFDFVLSKLENFEQCLLFLDARGGRTKTYTLNAILAAARTLTGDEITPALAVATSGIAATQLSGGRTFHSRMRAPIDIREHSVLNISVQSSLAQLIKHCAIIVWDEAPMANRFLLEALDKSLRDIMEKDIPFGGKSVILAGDFR